MARTFNQLREAVAKTKKHADFKGRILILGYGSVGQPILMLMLRHLNVDPSKITVLEKDDNKKIFDDFFFVCFQERGINRDRFGLPLCKRR